MKRRWTGIRVALSICAAICWWGVLYPELTMTPDTYTVVRENGAVQTDGDMIDWDSDEDIYQAVLKADGNRIRFRSKLLMRLEAFMDQLKE